MNMSAAPHDSQQVDAADTGASVLLLDTPENLGIDFLQMLQRQDLKLAFERVNDKEGLHAALRAGTWDILLACDQVNVPGQDETLAYLRQIESETGYVLLSKAPLSIDALTRAYGKGIAAVVSAHNPEFSLQVFAREAQRCRRNRQFSLLHREKGDLKRHCMQLMSGTQEALAYLQDGIHVFGNEAYLKLLGYTAMDDLLVLPFIDLVSTEMREKTKQRLLDFQHRARLRPDTKEFTIPELFVNAIGAREGILQVAATFKPVIHEGENCVQVVFKYGSGEEKREEAGAAEGLGYPLFVTHLDNLIGQARARNQQLGQVLHVRGTGCEHYIATRGFGSLNGKLRALTSELKACLGKDDLLIRFTETSFLVLCKSPNGELQQALTTLLGKFDKALNREIGAHTAPLVRFALDALPVDAQSPAAEHIVRSFLQSPQPLLRAGGVQEPGTDVPAAKSPAPMLPQEDALPVTAPVPDPQHVAAALSANQLRLMYETVISVADIETDFHDICVALPAAQGGEVLARNAAGSGELALKLDQWMLHHTLAVIADLYSRGQEYPVLIPLSAQSLANRRLAETLRAALQSFSLPAQMLVADFALPELRADPAGSIAQLALLKNDGISLCISDVQDPEAVLQIAQQVRVERVRLQRALVAAAAQDARAFTTLRQTVDRLHAMKIKVFAGDVANNSELALCCKAGIDLVKGKCIQKAPQQLDADSMAEALMA